MCVCVLPAQGMEERQGKGARHDSVSRTQCHIMRHVCRHAPQSAATQPHMGQTKTETEMVVVPVLAQA